MLELRNSLAAASVGTPEGGAVLMPGSPFMVITGQISKATPPKKIAGSSKYHKCVHKFFKSL